MVHLKNGLKIPPYAVADHINYNGRPVYYPGTYRDGEDQGNGTYGYYPPFCDNYYFVIMVDSYIRQTGDRQILGQTYNGLTLMTRLEYAVKAYNIDPGTELCKSDREEFTVDWGFTDTIQKTGLLAFASILRYRACMIMGVLCEEALGKTEYYTALAEKIRSNLVEKLYDAETGWLYSATGICRQHDVWATAYAVSLGILKEEKSFRALRDAFLNKTAVKDGYVRHIMTDEDARIDSAWESAVSAYNTYQNGGYWSTPTGWYARALYNYDRVSGEQLIDEFIAHTRQYAEKRAPYEWKNADTSVVDGLNYGTSGVLPYVAFVDLEDEIERTES